VKRTDNLQENALVKRITDDRAVMDGLKSAQRAGSASLQMNRVTTGNTADIVTTISYNVIQVWQITFTPTLQPFYNSGFLWRLFVEVVSQSGSLIFDNFTEHQPSESSVQVYNLYLMGGASGQTTTLNLQLVIYAIGDGTISVVQTV